ncbi:Ribulose bisphosphate carboxylase large chain [Dissostichus eleginoides]|uniref:Ribulose bisphosphate carboxylase large chain n=1 Tax=Dissostichus eleginoides TaxID=100907 RepID=A0AAD9BE56_DISEL|nr:Ribulose bisphosphate carboxylase large chain [Dissostichus eleginoides]
MVAMQALQVYALSLKKHKLADVGPSKQVDICPPPKPQPAQQPPPPPHLSQDPSSTWPLTWLRFIQSTDIHDGPALHVDSCPPARPQWIPPHPAQDPSPALPEQLLTWLPRVSAQSGGGLGGSGGGGQREPPACYDPPAKPPCAEKEKDGDTHGGPYVCRRPPQPRRVYRDRGLRAGASEQGPPSRGLRAGATEQGPLSRGLRSGATEQGPQSRRLRSGATLGMGRGRDNCSGTSCDSRVSNKVFKNGKNLIPRVIKMGERV